MLSGWEYQTTSLLQDTNLSKYYLHVEILCSFANYRIYCAGHVTYKFLTDILHYAYNHDIQEISKLANVKLPTEAGRASTCYLLVGHPGPISLSKKEKKTCKEFHITNNIAEWLNYETSWIS